MDTEGFRAFTERFIEGQTDYDFKLIACGEVAPAANKPPAPQQNIALYVGVALGKDPNYFLALVDHGTETTTENGSVPDTEALFSPMDDVLSEGREIYIETSRGNRLHVSPRTVSFDGRKVENGEVQMLVFLADHAGLLRRSRQRTAPNDVSPPVAGRLRGRAVEDISTLEGEGFKKYF